MGADGRGRGTDHPADGLGVESGHAVDRTGQGVERPRPADDLRQEPVVVLDVGEFRPVSLAYEPAGLLERHERLADLVDRRSVLVHVRLEQEVDLGREFVDRAWMHQLIGELGRRIRQGGGDDAGAEG